MSANNTIPRMISADAPLKIQTNDGSGHLGAISDEQSAAIIIRNSQAQAAGYGAIAFAFQTGDPTQAIAAHGLNMNYHCDLLGCHRFYSGNDYSDGLQEIAKILFSVADGQIQLLNKTAAQFCGLASVNEAGTAKLYAFDGVGNLTKLTP
jgi:hypothetical protein